jgi:hypothetical protein
MITKPGTCGRAPPAACSSPSLLGDLDRSHRGIAVLVLLGDGFKPVESFGPAAGAQYALITFWSMAPSRAPYTR